MALYRSTFHSSFVTFSWNAEVPVSELCILSLCSSDAVWDFAVDSSVNLFVLQFGHCFDWFQLLDQFDCFDLLEGLQEIIFYDFVFNQLIN